MLLILYESARIQNMRYSKGGVKALRRVQNVIDSAGLHRDFERRLDAEITHRAKPWTRDLLN